MADLGLSTGASRLYRWQRALVAALSCPGFALVVFEFYRATHGGGPPDRWAAIGILSMLLGAVVQMSWVPTVAPGPYAAAWKSYQLRGLVVGIPATVGVGLFFFTVYRVLRGLPPLWPLVMVLCGAFAALADAVLLKRWRCPRCGEAFFSLRWLKEPLATLRRKLLEAPRCSHCGLLKWASAPATDRQKDTGATAP